MGIPSGEQTLKAKKTKVYKPKKCAHCGETFTPDRYLQKVCDSRCAYHYQRNARLRKEAIEKKTKLKMRRLEVKPIGYFRQKAQAAFNAFIRERDAMDPCISCGKHFEGQYHAGHYRTVGSHPELRFDEDNCHKQCSICNNHHSGNLSHYRPNLIAKLGQISFDRLIGAHELKHYLRNDYEDIAATYRRKLKELKQKRVA